MVYRWNTLRYQETLNDVKVEPTDLQGLGNVSAILVKVEATNGATSNVDNEIFLIVRKITIKDGSKVLYDLTGIEAQAVTASDLKKLPDDVLDSNPDVVQSGLFLILLGRYLGDLEYFVNMNMLKNPKLEIDFNLANVRAAGATGYVTATGKLTILALHDEYAAGGAALGYIRNTEFYNWTTAAAGDETIDLPTDFVIRRIFLRCFESGVAITTNITDVEINCDNGKYIPIEEKVALTLDKMQLESFGEFSFEQRVFELDAGTFESRIALPKFGVVDAEVQDHLAVISSMTGGLITIQFSEVIPDGGGATPIAAAEAVRAMVKGCGFHNVLVYDFEKMNGLKVPEYKAVRMKVTQGDADAAAAVIIQEYARQ